MFRLRTKIHLPASYFVNDIKTQLRSQLHNFRKIKYAEFITRFTAEIGSTQGNKKMRIKLYGYNQCLVRLQEFLSFKSLW